MLLVVAGRRPARPVAADPGCAIGGRPAVLAIGAKPLALAAAVAVTLRAILHAVLAARRAAHTVPTRQCQTIARVLAGLGFLARWTASATVDVCFCGAGETVAADLSQNGRRIRLERVVGERTSCQAAGDCACEQRTKRQAASVAWAADSRNLAALAQ